MAPEGIQMNEPSGRREFIKILGFGGVVFASGLAGACSNIVRKSGGHDASLDQGQAFQENFGATHYSFDHKGIHFAVIDNVSDPQAAIGDAQLDWLLKDLKPLSAGAPIVVFTHRPLFD